MQLQLFLCPTRSCQNADGSLTTTNGACPSGSIPIEDKWYWAWYCEQAPNTPMRLLGRLIVSWVPSLLVTLWQVWTGNCGGVGAGVWGEGCEGGVEGACCSIQTPP